jgi:hypothetical protein
VVVGGEWMTRSRALTLNFKFWASAIRVAALQKILRFRAVLVLAVQPSWCGLGLAAGWSDAVAKGLGRFATRRSTSAWQAV